MDRHPYRAGFSVLPNLRKIDANRVFQPDPLHGPWFSGQKLRSMCFQRCRVEADCSQAVYAAAAGFVCDHYPLRLHGPCAVMGGWTGPWVFDSLARQVQEDLVIVRTAGDRDWVAAGHVCFPSGWDPLEKVGQSFDEVHAPVPGMTRGNGRKMAEAMVRSGPFERYVWSLVFSEDLNGHPKRPKAAFDPRSPAVWVRVERQVTVPLPEVDAALFVLQYALVGHGEIDAPALTAALESMPPEARVYKGLGDCFGDVIAFLRSDRTGWDSW